jgi:hypothetical protein
MTEQPMSELARVAARPSVAHALRKPKEVVVVAYLLSVVGLATIGLCFHHLWQLGVLLFLVWVVPSPYFVHVFMERKRFHGQFVAAYPMTTLGVLILAGLLAVIPVVGPIIAGMAGIVLFFCGLLVPFFALWEAWITLEDASVPPRTVLGCGKVHRRIEGAE